MDKEEAISILREYMQRFRSRTYRELLQLMKNAEQHEVRTASGKFYQMEFQAFYDDPKKQNVRVIGSIDDGGIRAIVPLCEDFIISPDGTFFGE